MEKSSLKSRSSLKIVLLGYGKMGQSVEHIANMRNHKIVAKIDPQCPEASFELSHADVIIDFTRPESVLANVKKFAPLGKNIVMGTTGWYEHLPEIKQIIKEENIGFFYSPNFSVGVNIFLKIVEEAAKLINHYPEYDIAGIEYHHNQKKDAPSGTAKAIAEKLLKNITRKKQVCYDMVNREIKGDEIHFPSLRTGTFPGTHTVIFDSQVDSINVTHTAKTREGFALGALLAAEWLKGKKGIYTMEDLFI